LRSVARPSLAWSSLRLARAAGRAQAVLLSAHFERYLYAINEEAIEFLNKKNIASSALSDRLTLLYSRYPIDELSENELGKSVAAAFAIYCGG